MKKVIISMLAASAIMLTSCSEDNDSPGKGENSLKVPDTYEFKDDKGVSTVSYSGQEARLAMATELKNALANPESTLEGLQKMFKEGKGFSSDELNNSGKKLRETFASATYSTLSSTAKEGLRNKVDRWIKQFIDYKEKDASNGTPGKLAYEKNGETKYRYLNDIGVELNQAFAKTFIGAVALDQVVNKYVSVPYLKGAIDAHEEGNSYKEGKNYTKLEHGWDEAYGYVFGKVDGNLTFLGKYLTKVDKSESFKGIKADIDLAFRKGRQAIVERKYDIMYKQAEILREKLSKVIAIRAVHYLDAGVGQERNAGTLHALSEGYGFVNALAFAHHGGKQMSFEHIDKTLQPLEKEGLWTIEDKVLSMSAKHIAEMFEFTVQQAK